MISLKNLIYKGVACEVATIGKLKPVCTMQWSESVDIPACETQLSGLREASYWPKNGFRSNLIASKFQKYYGGACHQTDLAV